MTSSSIYEDQLPAQSLLRRPRHRGVARRLLSVLASLTVTSLVTLGLVVIEHVPAQAAAAVGVGGYWTPAGGWLGNYVVGGKRVYCIDILTNTAGSGGQGKLSSSITEGGHGTRPVSGNELKMINYAVTVWGQTSNAVQAAAVSAFVYNFVSANWYGNGEHYITGPQAAAILLRYQEIKADTLQNYAKGTAAASGSLKLQIDPTNNYLGTLSVSSLSPASAKGTLTLVNGVFADTGLATRSGVGNNSSFAVIGVPPQDSSAYQISVSGAFTASLPPVFSPNVTIYAEGSMQRTVGPGSNTPSVVNFALSGSDSGDRSTEFRPEVGTRVASKFVAEDEEFADVLTFATVADESGLNNPWYQELDQRYAQVRAVGTIYGPFLSQPEETAVVPAGAPVLADNIEVLTSAEHGPTIDYTVPSGVLADEPGFYTWVWRIHASDQSPATQLHLPGEYMFEDRFAREAETSITPTNLAISTQIAQAEVTVGASITDDVTIDLHSGGWLQVDGGRVPATLTGTAYYSVNEPVLADAAPADAEVIGTLTLVVNRPTTVTSNEVVLPIKEGYVTFQWCLLEKEQPEQYRGLLRETCDRYGQASETAKIVVPTVVTSATDRAVLHEPIADTAVVQGQVTEDMFVEFSLYSQVFESGNPVCVADNLLDTSTLMPLTPGMNNATRYRSPEVVVDETGDYWWVERLLHIDQHSAVQTVLHAGICGLGAETSRVYVPLAATGSDADLTSQAVPVATGLFGSGAIFIAARVVHRMRSRRVRDTV